MTTPPQETQPMQDNEQTLLPCPFCGGEAKLAGPDNPASEYWVYHKECSSGPLSTNRERAIAAWNTRSTTPAQAPQQEVSEEIANIIGDECFGKLFMASDKRDYLMHKCYSSVDSILDKFTITKKD